MLAQNALHGALSITDRKTWSTCSFMDEAKLSFVKRSSRRGNFKNIQKTVVKHHQLWLCYQLECEGHVLCPEPQLSPREKCFSLSVESDTVRSQILTIAPSLQPSCTLKHHQWLKICSLVYEVGTLFYCTVTT